MPPAAQFRKLLDSCQEMAFSHLRPLVDRMFENADVALLDFAEKAESNMAQSLFFDAMNEVRSKRSAIEQHFYTELKRGFSEFPARPNNNENSSSAETDLGSLSLVDTDTVETFIATQNAAGKLAGRIMERIFALKQRLAVVNGGNAIEENQIPAGPAWLGAAFQHAVEQLELEHKVKLVFIALFDKYVLGRVDSLFEEYNKRLIQADILPNLRYEVRKQSGGIEIIEREIGESGEESAGRDGDNSPENDQTPSELGDELFGRICELMSGRRTRAPGRDKGISDNVSPLPSRQGDGQRQSGGGALLRRISTLQADHQPGGTGADSDEFIENIEIDENLIGRLQDALAGEREKILDGVDRQQLSGADTNMIELVGMMFEYMLKEEQLPNVVKALLSRLHTPLLKVAVIDSSFFTHHGHSARKLLNDMTAAGIRWVDESHLERGIFPRMRQIVDKVLDDFKEDVSLFDQLLGEFNEAVEEVANRASLVEKRTNEAASGQEKLLAARQRAQRELQDLLQGGSVAKAACDFLQRVLADKLTFVLLRSEDGEDDPQWRDTVALAERIIDSVRATGTGAGTLTIQEVETLQGEIREATSTLQQADKEKILHTLFELQLDIARGEDVAQTPAAEAVAVEEPSAETGAKQDAELSPEQKDMLEKLKNVPFGTWFEFHKPGEPKRRAKLSWRSTVTEKYMFVDQMGVRAAVVCMHELADCMLNGTARIVTAEKKPFVDRALSAIHRMLDHAA